MLVPKAFCDESHDGESKRVWVTAGYLGQAAEWERFSHDWAEALSQEHLSAFHMVDCEKGSEEFKGMSLEKRQSLQRRFIEIINSFKVVGAAGGIMLEAYNALLPRIKKHRKVPSGLSVSGSLHDPYFLAFQHTVEMIALNPSVQGLPQDETIAFVFDRHYLRGRAAALYSSILASKTLGYRHRLGSIAFDDKLKILPLQAADILAYEHYRYLNDSRLQGKPERWQWTEVKKKLPEWRLFDKEQLEKLLELAGW